jgi:uncharacterized protein
VRKSFIPFATRGLIYSSKNLALLCYFLSDNQIDNLPCISIGGGYMLQLAAFDRRVKAVSIVASGLNLGDTLSEMLGKEGFVKFLKDFNIARQKYFETGEVQYIPAVATDNKPAAMAGDEPFEYYGTSRAWSPGWANRYTTESIENLMSYNAVPYAHHVSPTPLLVIHGKNDKYCFPKFAHSKYTTGR